MTEIQQRSLYGKCSWRTSYGRKVKLVKLNLARRASGQSDSFLADQTRGGWLDRAVEVEETEGPLSSVGWRGAPGNGCCSGDLRRWTFWRPLVHRMILAGGAFPCSIQSNEFCRLVLSLRKWMLFRRSVKMDLLETFGPQDDFGMSGVSLLHPIKQSVLNKGL